MQDNFQKRDVHLFGKKTSMNGNFKHEITGTLVSNEKDKAMNLINASFLKLHKDRLEQQQPTQFARKS